MDHDVRRGRLQQSGTTTPMHLGSQRPLTGCLTNMHGRHPFAAKGPGGIFHNISGLLLAKHTHAMTRHRHGLQKWLLPLV